MWLPGLLSVFALLSCAAAAGSSATLQRRADGKPVCDATIPQSYDTSIRNCLVSAPLLPPATGNQSSEDIGYIPVNPLCSPLDGTRICGPVYTAVTWAPQALHQNSTVIITTTKPALSPPVFASNEYLRSSLGKTDSSRLRGYVNFTVPGFSASNPEVPIQLWLIEVFNTTNATTGQVEMEQRIYAGPNVTLVWYPNAIDDALARYTDQSARENLTASALAGLCIGTIVGIPLVILLTYCCLKRRLAKRKRTADSPGRHDMGARSEAVEMRQPPRVESPVSAVSVQVVQPQGQAPKEQAFEAPPPTYHEATKSESSRRGNANAPPAILGSIMDRGRGY